MAAILTDKFRVVFAEKFRQMISIGENQTLISLGIPSTTIWLFFAKSVQWDNGIPIDPVDNQRSTYEIYDQIIGLKKITSAEIRPMIRNNTWESGRPYDIYRDNYGNVSSSVGSITNYVQSLNFEQHLYETNFYVVTSEYKVYKCLSNANNGQSTVEPSSTSNAPFTLSDGYTWKYLFTVNANDFEKFKTDEFIPIPEDTAIDPNNVISADVNNFGGAIYNVLIDAPGSGYQSGQEFEITGDGDNGAVRVISTDNNGGITSLKIINPGSAYTYAQVNTTVGQNAVLSPIISPKEGMGAKIGRELGSYRLALHAKLDKDDFVFGNDFSIIGLLNDPTLTTNSNIAIGTKQLTLSGPLIQNFETYNDKKIKDTVTGATGRIVHYEADVANQIYTIFYTQENVVGYGIDTEGKRNNFESGNSVLIMDSEASTIKSGLNSVKDSELKRGSGEIIYIDNRNTISRAEDQTEDFKIILEF
jgi:hypothetical protein